MFYYLFYNSSFNFIVGDNRLFNTILYGSIIYILTHAILTYCGIEVLAIVKNYYWSLFALDLLSFTYCLYNDYWLGNNGKTDNNEGLNVSFNMLKNRIANIVGSEQVTNQGIRISTSPAKSPNTSNHSSFSTGTPVQEKQQQSPQTVPVAGSKSTPISLLRGGSMKSIEPIQSIIPNDIEIEQPIVEDLEFPDNTIQSYSESVAGSDVGSLMDLDEFERNL